MKKIILFQPIVGLLDNIKSSPGLPLSLLTAAKLLPNEFEVKIIDQRLVKDWKQALTEELTENVIFFGTTAMLGPQIKFACEASRFVKKNRPEISVVWGGPFASVLPEQALTEKFIDIIVYGDGENTLLSLACALRDKKMLEEVPGIIFKREGKVIKNPAGPLVDLNQLPDLPYHLVDTKKYLPKRGGVPTIDMETSRGCPFNCKFCYNPAFNMRRWRAYKPELILARIKKLKEDLGIKGVWFVDDEFFIDLGRARKIIEGLIELDMKWEIQGARADSILAMDDKYLKLLEKSHCRQINIGAESGSERILDMTEKKLTTKQILEVNRKLKPYKISPWFYFMIGFPSETEKEQRLTIKLAMRLLRENPNAKISGIGCFTPYPGTALFEESLKLGYQAPKKLIEWSSYGVDQINIPWLRGRLRQKVEAIQFASFFVDSKPEGVAGDWWVKLGAKLYRPIARWRFRHDFYGFPIDVYLGNMIKKRLAK
jgi:anaerobic magnesium-protoporphyrin IX monomethyl ester cyclase